MLNITQDGQGDPVYTTPNGTVYIAGGDNANCTLSTCPVELSVYGYRASLPFSSLVIALYGVVLIAQAYLGQRYRAYGFMTAAIFGCLCEILGYAGRIMMWNNPWNHSGFILQIVLITIGPVFFSAAIYVLLYQIATYLGSQSSRFSPRLFYWVFIPCDIVSLVLQAVGGAMSATANGSSGNQNAGVNIALAGLAFQVFTLVLFIAAALDLMWYSKSIWRLNKLPRKFKGFCVFLAAATIFILIRCCYRVYELSEGYSRTSEALRNQPLFIALEGVMVVAAACCLVVAHPGPAFSGEKSLSDDSEKPSRI